MLKWAVTCTNRHKATGSQQLTQEEIGRNISKIFKISQQRKGFTRRRSLNNFADPSSWKFTHETQKLRRRKSTCSDIRHPKETNFNPDKENHLTSTPLPIRPSNQELPELSKLDVSFPGIQDKFSQSPLTAILNKETFTENNNQMDYRSLNKKSYASTLPTFDVEYSPCGTTPELVVTRKNPVGTVLDTYINKPRYIENESISHSTPCYRRFPNQITKDYIPAKLNLIKYDDFNSYFDNESITSSSRAEDDTSLDHMISVILDSAQKEHRKLTKLDMSSTYTPAEDPASDLSKIWDDQLCSSVNTKWEHNTWSDADLSKFKMNDDIGTYDLDQRKMNVVTTKTILSPGEQNNNSNNWFLRRQRAIRRKKKLSKNFLKSTIKNSAQKLFQTNTFLSIQDSRSNNEVAIIDNEILLTKGKENFL